MKKKSYKPPKIKESGKVDNKSMVCSAGRMRAGC